MYLKELIAASDRNPVPNREFTDSYTWKARGKPASGKAKSGSSDPNNMNLFLPISDQLSSWLTQFPSSLSPCIVRRLQFILGLYSTSSSTKEIVSFS